jgi:hypothetical protein
MNESKHATLLLPAISRPELSCGVTSPLRVFLSYAGRDAFEAALLQECLETRLAGNGVVVVWTFERDQRPDESSISRSVKETVQDSVAVIFLLSPFTIEAGSTQWMELAYADAFGIPVFILLHHLTYDDLKRVERGVPPLILQSQCTPAVRWRGIESDLRELLRYQAERTSSQRSEGGPE